MKILGVFAATAVLVIAVADLPGQSKEYCRNFPQSEACAGHINRGTPQEDAQDSASARKRFVEAVRQKVIKEMGSNLTPGYNTSAEGPDATLYVLHEPGVTFPICNDMVTQGFVLSLRKFGFTYFVCTDDGNKKFTFDLAQQSPVNAQSPAPVPVRPVESPPVNASQAVQPLPSATTLPSPQAQDQAEIRAAIIGARYLHDHMREPDSFQLGVVYLKPNRKNKPPNICFSYKGKNGFGGYSAGNAVQKPTKNGYSYPFDPDEVHGEGMFYKVDCNPKHAIDITDRVKEGLGFGAN